MRRVPPRRPADAGDGHETTSHIVATQTTKSRSTSRSRTWVSSACCDSVPTILAASIGTSGAHLMAEFRQLARPVMRGAARFDAYRQEGNLAKNGSICARRSDLRTTTWSVASSAVDLKNALGQVSRPIVVIFMADGSRFARERPGAFTLAPSYRQQEPSTSTAFGRRQSRLTGNLVSSPAPDRVSVGTRFKQWPRRAMTHGFGVPTARTERASVRRT